jgi:hypothetical protein
MPALRRAAIATAIASTVLLGSVSVAAPALAAPTSHSVVAQKAATKSKVRSWAERQYGTFTTWRRSGEGDDLLTLPKKVKAAVVTARTDGESNFIVETLNKKNHEQDLLVNEIGAYKGTSVFGLETKSKAKRLKITADGSWTIVVKAVWKTSGLPKSHTGDGVYLFNKPAGALKLTHTGSSNFIVTQHTGGTYGFDLLVNEIGHYRGTVPNDGGPSVVEVQADGHWTTHYRR